MNVSVERVVNDATLKITLPAEEVNKGFKKAISKIANSVNIPGFRKGKAPRNIIEMHYGKMPLNKKHSKSLLMIAILKHLIRRA